MLPHQARAFFFNFCNSYTSSIITAITKKMIAQISVRIETTFSAPLSLVLTKTFNPPPVIAPEAPSDLPPWSKQRTIMIIAITNNIQSYHCNIGVLPFCSCVFNDIENKLITQIIFAINPLLLILE